MLAPPTRASSSPRLLLLLLVATVLSLGLLATLAVPAAGQPSSPPFASFDVTSVPNQRKTASWSPRSVITAFRTVQPFEYYNLTSVTTSGLVTAPAGSFLMLGASADIWVSTDGFTWSPAAGPSTLALGYVPNWMATTYTFAWGQCVCKSRTTDRLYVIMDGTTWVSSNYARNWTRYDQSGIYRSWMLCFVGQDETIYTVDGTYIRASIDGGATWQWRSDSPWWQDWRVGHFGGHFYSDRFQKDIIYAMGGGRPAYNDVWVSSDGARTWALLSNNAPWPARYDARLGIADNGVLIVASGRPDDSNYFNDVWASADGGFNWWLLRQHSSFTPRGLPAVVVDSLGYYWIFGGTENVIIDDVAQTQDTNSIVRSTRSFNDIIQWGPLVNRKMYTPPSSCLGLGCWPNSTNCACSFDGDFNFASLGRGAFPPHFHSFIGRNNEPISYRGLSNGVLVAKSLPGGSYVLFGGVYPGTVNQGWVSADLTTWEPIYGPPAVQIGLVSGTDFTVPTHAWGQAVCSHPNGNAFYLIGGDNRNEVFRSSDGKFWSAVSTAFGSSSYGVCTVYGSGGNGVNGAGAGTVLHFQQYRTFISVDSGTTWTSPTVRGTPNRASPFGGSYYSYTLQRYVFYIMGGIWGSTLNDVWVTTDNGANFYQTTSAAAWPARADAITVVDTTGVVVVMAGQSDWFTIWFNDAWFSADGGYRWFELTSADAVTSRAFPAAFVNSEHRIVQAAGNTRETGYVNDIYISDAAFRLDTILTWGEKVAPPFAWNKPPAGCIGLTCLPNATQCPCGARSRAAFDLLPLAPAAAWTPRFTISATRLRRDHTVLLGSSGTQTVLPANSWVVYGGTWSANDVWASTNKGQTWSLLAGKAGSTAIPRSFWDSYLGLEGQGQCASPLDDTLFVMGGKYGGTWSTAWVQSVWRSRDFQDWVMVQDVAASGPGTWPGRAYLMCSVDHNGLLYATGGHNGNYWLIDADTYVSSDGGSSWARVTSTSEYPGRAAFFGGGSYSRFTGRTLLYTIGGVSWRNFNDVWASSDGGKSWALFTSLAPWAARADTSVGITDSGVIVLYGGQGQQFLRWYADVWMSMDGGFNWFEVAPVTAPMPRTFPATIIDENGFFWVLGGNVQNYGFVNEVYRSSLAFSDSEIERWAPLAIGNLTLPRDTTGAVKFGLACWPGTTCNYVVMPPVGVDGTSGSGGCGSAASSSTSLSSGAAAAIALGIILAVLVLAAAVILVRARASSGKPSFEKPHGREAHIELEESQTSRATHEAEETA